MKRRIQRKENKEKERTKEQNERTNGRDDLGGEEQSKGGHFVGNGLEDLGYTAKAGLLQFVLDLAVLRAAAAFALASVLAEQTELFVQVVVLVVVAEKGLSQGGKVVGGDGRAATRAANTATRAATRAAGNEQRGGVRASHEEAGRELQRKRSK